MHRGKDVRPRCIFLEFYPALHQRRAYTYEDMAILRFLKHYLVIIKINWKREQVQIPGPFRLKQASRDKITGYSFWV